MSKSVVKSNAGANADAYAARQNPCAGYTQPSSSEQAARLLR